MANPNKDCAEAAAIIRSGGIVAFPTETVYGLGADAFNSTAVARVFAAKERPRFDPLIVHIYDIDQLPAVAETVPESARKLIDTFWPGPLTIVVPKKQSVPDIVTAGLPNVGIRMPNHPLALDLLRLSKTPIAAPSANKFGQISPTCAQHVRDQLKGCVDCILDGGNCCVGVESTIVSFIQSEPVLLRPGGISREAIEIIIGPLRIPEKSEFTDSSPGRSLRHYAPDTPLFLGAAALMLPGLKKGLLAFTPEPSYVTDEYSVVEVLSQTGNLDEAACNLFAAMRRLDHCGLDLIMVKTIPNRGLGVAINDRLFRASQSRRSS